MARLLGAFSQGWRGFSSWGKRNPVALNVCAAMTLGGTGDMIAQKIEGAESIDPKRALCVCAWYGPAAALFWTPYMAWQERLFGSSGLRSVLYKVIGYNMAMATVDISGFHIVSLTPQVGLEKATLTLTEGYSDALVAGLTLWVPAMALIYWRMPVHLVMSTSYALDVVWASTMSFLSNRKKKLLEDAAPQGALLAPKKLGKAIEAPGAVPGCVIAPEALAGSLALIAVAASSSQILVE